jgi:mxaJ protein
MYSRCLSLFCLAAFGFAAVEARELRVCADPNNLPFSNQAGEGLENRLAQLLASELTAELKYTWWSERKSFLENSLEAGLCDVVLGVPSTMDSVLVSKPYYRSTYTFVERRDRGLNVSSLTDSRLEQLRIGIHVVGEDYAPPAHLLARRGLAGQLVGYSLYGKYGDSNPPSVLIDAVVRGEVDLAIIWGPFAGYFSKSYPSLLKITPVTPAAFMEIPFTYGISVAVRQSDSLLLAQIEHVMDEKCDQIAALLAQFAIPLLQEGSATCESLPQAVSSLH